MTSPSGNAAMKFTAGKLSAMTDGHLPTHATGRFGAVEIMTLCG